MPTLKIDPLSLIKNPKDPREQIFYDVVLPKVRGTLRRYLYLDAGQTYEITDLENLCWEPVSLALLSWRPTQCQSFVKWATYHIQHELQKTFSGKDRDVWAQFPDGSSIRLPYTQYKKKAKALKAQEATITFCNLVEPLNYPDQTTTDESQHDSYTIEHQSSSLTE